MWSLIRIMAAVVIPLGVASMYAQSVEAKDAVGILRTFKTIYVQSKTPLAKPQMLASELQKSSDFDNQPADSWDTVMRITTSGSGRSSGSSTLLITCMIH